MERQKFTSSERVTDLLNSEAAKHERPGSLRRSIMDTETPLELPRGTVVVEVNPSSLTEENFSTISTAIDTTPISAFNNEKGYVELNGASLDDPSLKEGKIALLYDSSVEPDEKAARTPAAVLVLETLTPEQLKALREKLPDGVPLLDAKTNKAIEPLDEDESETASRRRTATPTRSSSYSETVVPHSDGATNGSDNGYVWNGPPMSPEEKQQRQEELDARDEEFKAQQERDRKAREEQRARQEESDRQWSERIQRKRDEEDARQQEREAYEEEERRQAEAESIVRGEEIRERIRQERIAKEEAERARRADIERRAEEIRQARVAATEALDQKAA